MQFLDFSPPTSPTLGQQVDALQKGLGRAVQWAQAGCLADEPLLDACLHDKRFDMLFEDNRGEWLWNIINAVGAVTRFREPILVALRSVTIERDAYQLCELALHYATTGDREFEAQLYKFVEQRPFAEHYPSIGEGQLFELGGEEALLFIARIRGMLLNGRNWEWDDSAITDRAIEKFGVERVSTLLNDSTDPAINRFEAAWRQSMNQPSESQPQSYVERMRAISAAEIIKAAETKDRRYPGWGNCADESDLDMVLNYLWIVREPKVIANLLKVFSNRPLAHFDTRLLELCRHGNDDVQREALNVLEQNTHPLIRDFALKELQERTLNRSVVGLFAANFMDGDEQRLLDLVELPEDAWERHGVLIELLHVLEENPNADSSQLGLIIYFQTPCELCRLRAVEQLREDGVVPEWLIRECRNDSGEDCRALVAEESAEQGGQCTN